MAHRLLALVAPAALIASAGCSSGPPDPVRDLGEDSALGTLIADNPELEAKVVEGMSDGAGMFASDDDRKRYAESVAGPIVNEHMKPRMAALNDEMLSRLSAVTSQRVLETISSGDDCMRPIEGRDNSLVSGLGEERMKPILLDIAKMVPDPSARVASKEELVISHIRYADEIANRGGLEFARLMSLLQGQEASDKVERCRMAAGVLGAFAALPPSQGGPLLRALYER